MIRVAAIGNIDDHTGKEVVVDSTYFHSSTSFLEYDVLILDLNYALNEYTHDTKEMYMGYPCLDDNDSARLKKDAMRRKTEIASFLELGRCVFLFMPQDPTCYVATGEKQYSGTGKNQKTTRIVNTLSLLNILPEKIVTETSSGSQIETTNQMFSPFLKKFGAYLEYNSYFSQEYGQTLCRIKGTSKSVGAVKKSGNGYIVFIPSFYHDDGLKEFMLIKGLVEISRSLVADVHEELPEWSNLYFVLNEKEETEKLKKYSEDYKRIEQKIKKQNDRIYEIKRKKLLFTGTGKALENEVRKVFVEMGVEMLDAVDGRDDLIMQYKGRIAVAEIKGVAKSAAEKHAAQLEKWVSEYYSSKAILPKGILIVNGYKDLPLAERTENVFPDQMISYSQNRNHCLLSGIQLYNVYSHCVRNKEKAEEILDLIWDTSGCLDSFNDWRVSCELDCDS